MEFIDVLSHAGQPIRVKRIETYTVAHVLCIMALYKNASMIPMPDLPSLPVTLLLLLTLKFCFYE